MLRRLFSSKVELKSDILLTFKTEVAGPEGSSNSYIVSPASLSKVCRGRTSDHSTPQACSSSL